jgi:hypothetical protein
MERDPFVVDLNNSDDMSAKLNEAKRHRDDAEREFEHWNGTVQFLESRVKTAPPLVEQVAPSTVSPMEVMLVREQLLSNSEAAASVPDVSHLVPIALADLVAEVVNREQRKIRSREVCRILQEEGHDVTTNGVSNALYYATNKAQPPKIKAARGRGMYAPLSFEEETNFDPPQNGQVSQARPEEPYSAPEEEDRVQAPRGSEVGVLGGAGQRDPQQAKPALRSATGETCPWITVEVTQS